MIYKTLHIKLKIAQHNSYKNTEVKWDAPEGYV